jgi:hypothetical protein
MINLLRFIVVIIAVVCFSRCQSSSARTAGKLEVGFAVDSQLVSRVVRDTSLKVSYRLPAQWQDMTADASVNSIFSSDSSHQAIHLVRFAGDTAARLMFSLTDIRTVPDDQYKELKRNYHKLLNGDHRWKKVKESDFTKDGFYVHQYMMTNAVMVNFRLIFFREMKPLVQLDFQAPVDSTFANHTKILESIIGSFNSIL